MTKTELKTETARSFPLHSIFTHPFGSSRPVYDAPNDGGAANPPADPPANPPANPPADPANPPADPNAKPKPSDEEARLIKEVMEEKKAKKALEAQLKQFEGINLEEVQALVQAKKDADDAKAAAEEEAALKRGEFDRVKAQMVEQHTAALDALKAQLAERDATITNQTATIENLTVGSQFASSDYISKNLVLPVDIARGTFGSYFDVEGDAAVAYDKPRGAAERTKLVDAAGNPLPFDLALEKLVSARPDKDKLLRSKQVPGAGSGTIDKTPPAAKPASGLTGMARIAANLDKLKPLDVKL